MLSSRALIAAALLALLALPVRRAIAIPQQMQEATPPTSVELDDATARKLVKGCSVPHEVSARRNLGDQIIVTFDVSEKGKLLGVHRVQGDFTHELAQAFSTCHFSPYKVNGTPTPFHANVIINVK